MADSEGGDVRDTTHLLLTQTAADCACLWAHHPVCFSTSLWSLTGIYQSQGGNSSHLMVEQGEQNLVQFSSAASIMLTVV